MIRPYFKWYDLWIGVFIDRPKKIVYVGLLPTVGFWVRWG